MASNRRGKNPKSKANLKPFRPGYDPRRNLKGIPADAVAAREWFRNIGAELTTIRAKDENGKLTEYDVTRLEKLTREKFDSSNPRDFELLLKAMFPSLLKDEIDVTTNGKDVTDIGVKLIDYRTGITPPESGPGGDRSTPGQDKDPGNG